LRAAERAAGRTLLEIDSGWARAWASVLVGKEPWAGQRAAAEQSAPIRARVAPTKQSIWQTLGLAADATLLDIKRAYKKRALETHPDRGGAADDFRAVQSAYEAALKRRARPARKTSAR
jgi:hypothetical protein